MLYFQPNMEGNNPTFYPEIIITSHRPLKLYVIPFHLEDKLTPLPRGTTVYNSGKSLRTKADNKWATKEVTPESAIMLVK